SATMTAATTPTMIAGMRVEACTFSWGVACGGCGVLWLSLFFVLLIGLPVLAELMPSQTMAMVDSFYRVGSLVFGGGHVVLPLLQAEVVPSGWVNNESFL
ncbi:chromate transporter, partial [Escherichia coli]|uniref:chromate transporter n=1 Tax=Escherichia coli TaxID=562 RepID=UPI00359C53F2